MSRLHDNSRGADAKPLRDPTPSSRATLIGAVPEAVVDQVLLRLQTLLASGRRV